MHSHSSAAAAYQSTSRSIGTPRSIEYQAFQRATARLCAAQDNEDDFPALADAVHQNTQLWTVLAIDVAGDGNQLPKKLRAQILSLADFSRKHGAKALSRQASLGPLIEINTAIMRGLRGNSGAAEEA